ncbi:hypothetical protein BDR04DRAFT_1086904 [Suillus decipiens]|nr:hypothetical protein BDR04DRAFT_1086904 [Suillus decipiens]
MSVTDRSLQFSEYWRCSDLFSMDSVCSLTLGTHDHHKLSAGDNHHPHHTRRSATEHWFYQITPRRTQISTKRAGVGNHS